MTTTTWVVILAALLLLLVLLCFLHRRSTRKLVAALAEQFAEMQSLRHTASHLEGRVAEHQQELEDLKQQHLLTVANLEEAHRRQVEELEAELADFRNSDTIVAQVRLYREALEEAREEFLQFLETCFAPVDKFKIFVDSGEEAHAKIARLIAGLDASLAELGLDSDGPTLILRLPANPEDVFKSSEIGVHDPDQPRLVWRALSKIAHSDPWRHIGLKWTDDFFDTLFSYLTEQYELTKQGAL